MPTRRDFLKIAACTLASASLPRSPLFAQHTSANLGPLPDWQPGILEIHQIDTGRGNAAFILYPDGTTLLLDAGESHSAPRTMPAPLPNASRPAGEWIARYVASQLTRAHRTQLDLTLITHLHGDHIGEVAPTSPLSPNGPYRLTGLAIVAGQIPIREIIDRGWPAYDYPPPLQDPTSRNYIQLVQSLSARGTRIEQAAAGSFSQLAPRRDPAGYPDLTVRILSVNGQVAGPPRQLPTPHLPLLPPPTENMCSVSIRLQYGAFRFFSGGDLTCDTDFGEHPGRDIETPAARAAGPVSVAVADHHGYFDATGPDAVRALRPRVWILPEWHVSHPALGVLASLFSTALYPGERSVFALGITPEALLTNERFSSRLSSTRGHIVLRVPPGGRDFTVSILDARDETGTVTARFGPFPS